MSAITPIFYKISSSDGTVFNIEKKCLMMSNTLKDCASNLGYTDDNVEEKDPIPVLNVSTETFKLVQEYMEHHKDEEEPGAEAVISEWDANFLNIDGERMFDLTCAANFLDIKGLLNITCKTIANMIKGKNPEEMRQIWQIPTDEEDEAAGAVAADTN